ncbi:LLM class flavin-dependent oxidoreductase [Nocardioides jensenii]|uniref:LLM class flavin-dependent oxidoreductase n=1 Tax=Nocardioides jensenii TaxID=1843 RepID=UPI000835D5EC|nr:LLM class flavin-dependent oxidoreductase [Nocardioides jensenii]
MELGLFMMPAHPEGRDPYEAAQWDLQMIEWADELGYSEAWIGEHFTATFEPCPAPDLLIAQALTRTSQIKLGAGAHLLPMHHPAELASRVAYLDHLSQGRLLFGVGASSVPGDWSMFDLDGAGGQTREMTAESLEIILKLWTDKEPFEYKGKYWTVRGIETMYEKYKRHIYPLQDPHPRIGVSGFSSPSPTLELAGERGFIPMSLNIGLNYVKDHWGSVLAGAKRAGRTPDRKDWHIAKDIFVAETDEEAYEYGVKGDLGKFQDECLLYLYGEFGFKKFLKHDQNVPDSEVDAEYCAKHNWLIGSPDTVAEGLANFYDAVGGFGTVLALGYDYIDNPDHWEKSMGLLAHEVMPRFHKLRPEAL